MAFEIKDGSVVIKVKVTPSAKQNSIKQPAINDAGDHYIPISITTAPEKGKANKAVIKMLAKEWHLPKSVFSVISGEITRHKKIKILGDADSLYEVIQNWVK